MRILRRVGISAAISALAGVAAFGGVATAAVNQGDRVQLTAATVQLNVKVLEGGYVTGPGDIDCPRKKCVTTFPVGTKITLVARENIDYRFSGWFNKDCKGDLTLCVLTMDTNKTVEARFRQEL
jgi:hypothetical protein